MLRNKFWHNWGDKSVDWPNLGWYFDFEEYHGSLKHLNSYGRGSNTLQPKDILLKVKTLQCWCLVDRVPNWNLLYCKYPVDGTDFHARLVWYIQISHSEYFEYFAFYCLAGQPDIHHHLPVTLSSFFPFPPSYPLLKSSSLCPSSLSFSFVSFCLFVFVSFCLCVFVSLCLCVFVSSHLCLIHGLLLAAK